MNSEVEFYICPICFMTAGTPRSHHRRPMICFSSLRPGDDLLKPLMDEEGRLATRAPRWFLDSVRPAHGHR